MEKIKTTLRQPLQDIKTKKDLGRDKWFLKWWVILLITLGIIFIAFSIYFMSRVSYYHRLLRTGSVISANVLGQYSSYGNDLNSGDIQINRAELEANDEPRTGAEDPVMTIVEFADYDCPYCVVFYENLKYFVAENKDDVQLIFRDFPLHDDGLAMFANCALEQDKFWKVHDYIFDNFDNFDENLAYSYVKNLGVNLDQFKDCYQNKKYEAEINDDLRVGLKSGVKGTPTIFINGEIFAGVMNQDILGQILAVLKNSN